MNYDEFGQLVITTNEICKTLYNNPDMDLKDMIVVDPEQYNSAIDKLHLQLPKLKQYTKPDVSIKDYDQNLQQTWFMPEQYACLDIAEWILQQCTSDAELQRVAQELLMFQERNLFPLLNYLKYLVDTMRENNIVWGVGRGSSVASFVLYKLGVHHINSLYFDLDIREFLKE